MGKKQEQSNKATKNKIYSIGRSPRRGYHYRRNIRNILLSIYTIMLKTRRDSAFIPAKTEGTAAALSSTLKQTLIPLGEEQRTRVSDLETPAKLNFVDGIRKRFTLVRNSQFYDDINNIHPNDDVVEKAHDDDEEEEFVEVCCWKIPILTSISRANNSSDHRFR